MKLILMVGPSRSGKTTLANKVVNENIVCVSRDKIREQLFSYSEENIHKYYSLQNFNKNEKLVTKVLFNNIRFLLSEGFDVIVDNTHLKKEYIQKYFEEFPECDIDFLVPEHLSIKDCIERDNNSIRKVGEEVIKKQFEQYRELIGNFPLFFRKSSLTKIEQDESKMNVMVFDIDGTLSDSSHRHIFSDNDEEIYNDKVIKAVQTICNSNYPEQIIFVSGRSEKYHDVTEKWIKDKVFCNNNAPLIYMRKSGDMRKDTIVKEEIFREISKDFNILYAIDDRLSVTRHLRKLGIFVLNCNQLEKEF